MALRKLLALCKCYHWCIPLGRKQGQTIYGILAEKQPIFQSRVTCVAKHSGANFLAINALLEVFTEQANLGASKAFKRLSESVWVHSNILPCGFLGSVSCQA